MLFLPSFRQFLPRHNDRRERCSRLSRHSIAGGPDRAFVGLALAVTVHAFNDPVFDGVKNRDGLVQVVHHREAFVADDRGKESDIRKSAIFLGFQFLGR